MSSKRLAFVARALIVPFALSACQAVTIVPTEAITSQNAASVRLLQAASELKLYDHTRDTGCRAISFSPDGRILACANARGYVKILDAAHMKLLARLRHPDVRSISFNANGSVLATAGSTDASLRLWDLKKLKDITPKSLYGPGTRCASFSPSGRALAAAQLYKPLLLWRIENGRIADEAEEINLGLFSAFVCLAFDPKGELLAVAWGSTQTSVIDLWDLRAGKIVGRFYCPSIISEIAFSPDGRLLASAGFNAQVILWDLQRLKQLSVLSGHENKVRSVAFNPNGDVVATGSDDGTLRLWAVKTGSEIKTLVKFKNKGSSVLSVAFSPDGKLLASGCLEGTLVVTDRIMIFGIGHPQ